MLYELDLYIFKLINQGFSHPWLDALGKALQDPDWFLVGLGILGVYLLWKGDRRARLFVLTAVVAVIAADVLCAQVLKPLIARPRPTMTLTDIRALVGKKSGYGMPSNHAANMMAAAVVVGWYYRRYLGLALAVAVLIGLSRIYVGVHYPLDVLLGFGVGAVVAALAVSFFAQYLPTAHPDLNTGNPVDPTRPTKQPKT